MEKLKTPLWQFGSYILVDGVKEWEDSEGSIACIVDAQGETIFHHKCGPELEALLEQVNGWRNENDLPYVDLDFGTYNSEGSPILIIKANTGFYVTAQTGGVFCDHPSVEGYPIKIDNIFSYFDDCSAFCCGKGDDWDYADLDEFLQEHSYPLPYKLQFDWGSKYGASEGWLPVLVSGIVEGIDIGNEPVEAILHLGNCD